MLKEECWSKFEFSIQNSAFSISKGRPGEISAGLFYSRVCVLWLGKCQPSGEIRSALFVWTSYTQWVRNPRKSFHYTAVVREGDIRDREVVLEPTAVPPVGDGTTLPRPSDCRVHTHLENGRSPGLVGAAPRMRFREERMNLISAPPHAGALAKWCAFPVGDLIERCARVGDVIQTYRSSAGALSLAMFRQGRLLAAVGDLVSVELERLRGAAQLDYHVRCTHPDVIEIKGRRGSIPKRGSMRVGGYDVYVETWPERVSIYTGFGPSILSVAAASDPLLVNSARRSAVLMGHVLPSLYGELKDGTFIRSFWEIP